MGSFSTLPRVELPGATLPRGELPGAGRAQAVGPGPSSFQYPTSGRTAWSACSGGCNSNVITNFQYPTSGRTAWSSAACRKSRNAFILSVPYLGSNCLNGLGKLAPPPQRPGRTTFSTLPRVEQPGAPEILEACDGLRRCFQYPTSGRTAWSCFSRASCIHRLPTFSTLPRVELPGAF